MLEKRRITVSLLDLICLFIGRVFMWTLITLLFGICLKGCFNLITFILDNTILFKVLDVILWILISLVILFMCFVICLIIKNIYDKPIRKSHNKNASKYDTFIPEIEFIDLDNE